MSEEEYNEHIREFYLGKAIQRLTEKGLRECLNITEHWWRKGYLKSKELFAIFKKIVYEKNPYAHKDTLRLLVLNVFEKRNVLRDGNPLRQGWLGHHLIDNKLLMEIWEEEFKRLEELEFYKENFEKIFSPKKAFWRNEPTKTFRKWLTNTQGKGELLK